jgi:uncharacterized membrane protein YhhN
VKRIRRRAIVRNEFDPRRFAEGRTIDANQPAWPSLEVTVIAATNIRETLMNKRTPTMNSHTNSVADKSAGRGALPLSSLIAVSGLIAILAFVGVLPDGLAFVFKPLTTLLILALAWPRGADAPRQRVLVRVGLVLSLAGDVFLLWPREGFLPGLVAFALAHLAYIAAFCVPLRLGARPIAFAGYAVVAASILAMLWPGIPAALRVPVVVYVLCLATMAAQALSWWRDSLARGVTDASLARMAALGGALFMLSDGLLATNKFAVPLPLSSLFILATYWLAQWCIAESLATPHTACQ